MDQPPAMMTSDPENGLTWRRTDLMLLEIHLSSRTSNRGSDKTRVLAAREAASTTRSARGSLR